MNWESETHRRSKRALSVLIATVCGGLPATAEKLMETARLEGSCDNAPPPMILWVTQIPIEIAAAELAKKLQGIQGIVGVEIGDCDGHPCLRVYLENDYPELQAKVPAHYKGFNVITEATGLSKPCLRTSRL